MNQERIIEIVSDHFGITVEEIKSKVKKRRIVVPRQFAMSLIYKYTVSSLDHIGSYFLGRNKPSKDHTTVMHALEMVKDLRATMRKHELDWKFLCMKINQERKREVNEAA